MHEVKVNETTLKMDKGFVLGFEGDVLNYAVIGELTIDEALELLFTLLSETLRTFDHATNHEHTYDLYEKAVVAFSFMIDRFYPEAKNLTSDFDVEVKLKAIEDGILQGK